MSDLLMILVGLGLLIVVGVLLFNWWQERAFHQQVDHNFKPSKRDVLIEDFQVNTENIRQERAKSTQKTRIEPSLASDLERDASLKQAASSAYTTHLEKIEEETATAASTSPLPTSSERQFEAIRRPSAEQYARAEPDLSESSIETFDNSRPNENHLSSSSAGLSLQVEDTDAQSIELELADNTDTAASNIDVPTEFSPTKPMAPSHVIDEVSLPPALHPQIDLIALLFASSPIPYNAVKQLSSQLKDFNEHTFAFGLGDADTWQELSLASANSTFSQIAYGLQLADRGGAVSRAILNRFQHMIETIGLDLSAHVEWQGNGDPLNHAVSLDQFCIEVDKTVGFHLLANAGATFHATKLRGLLEAQGLTLGNDGRYHLMSTEHGGLEFAIKNFEGNPFSAEMVKSSVMHGITFQLDIPTVKNSAQVFDRMVVIAKALAKTLDASMMDDNRRPLGDIQLEKIRQQLKVINAKMIAIGIIPGSQHALRLFS